MRRALSVLASVLVAVLLLAAVELVLRGLGAGDLDERTVSRLEYQQVVLPTLAADVRGDGAPIWRTTDPRVPYQAVPREKAPGTLRVFTFGGSATAGLGFSPNVTFARHLEVLLRAAHPESPVEVINLGIVALPSKKVRLLVLDVLAHGDPDAIVVYSGNNEFLEIHATKFAEHQASVAQRLRGLLTDSNLYRLLRPPPAFESAANAPDTRALAQNDARVRGARVSEARMIEEVELSAAEVQEIEDAYEANLRDIARAGVARDVPVLLMTVAANWEWLGSKDLPASWPEEFAGPSALASAGAPERDRDFWERTIAGIDARLAGAAANERCGLLYRRGLARRELGSVAGARDDLRAAMNADPHLRRATDALAERVRRVAREEGIWLVDTIEHLARAAPDGVVGFRDFYDYVHFTPEGAAESAVAILDGLHALGLVADEAGAAGYVAGYLAGLAARDDDPLGVREWLGVGFDLRAGILDRDLWKYDRKLDEIGRIAESNDGRRGRALVYRGNAAYFRIDGAAQAERDWRAALEVLGEHPDVEANLALLAAESRPAALSPLPPD